MSIARVRPVLAALAVSGMLTGCLGAGARPTDDTPLAVRTIGTLRLAEADEAKMLHAMAAWMIKAGSLSTLQEAAGTADHVARLYASTRNQTGVFAARMLQADALIQLDRLDEAGSALAQGEAAAQSAQCPVCLSEFHTRRAQVATVRRDWDRATADFDTAVSILEPRRDNVQQARIRLFQSALALKARQLEQAETSALAAETHAARTTDARLKGLVHAQLSEVHFERQDFPAAADRMERAQLAFAEAGASLERVTALCRLSRVGFGTRDPHKARQRIAEAEAVAGLEKSPGPRARQWLLIADAYARLGDREAEARGFAAATAVYQEAGSSEGLAAIEVLRIMNALHERDFDGVAARVATARQHLAPKPTNRQAKDRQKDPQAQPVDVSPLPLTHWQMTTSLDVAEGFLLIRQLKLQEALARFHNAERLARNWNQPGLLASAAALRADVLVQLSQFREAEQAYATALEAYRRDGNDRAAEQTRLTLERVRRRNSAGS